MQKYQFLMQERNTPTALVSYLISDAGVTFSLPDDDDRDMQAGRAVDYGKRRQAINIL